MSRERLIGNRKLVAYRLLAAQVRRLEQTAELLGKTRTQIIEEALAMYFNRLHIDGVI